jgi:hypothetical protein
MSDGISEVFIAIMAYAEKQGVRRINELDGCWEFSPAEGWFLAVNGHDVPKRCSKNADVPPFHAYVEWHGWPAGIVGPKSGILAAGTEANEDNLIAALNGGDRTPRAKDPR